MRAVARVAGFCCAMVTAWAGVPIWAQTNADINSGLQFSFVPPGARSLGMGGAFVGVASDATAAWTNPSGLVFLTRPEVSIEGRTSRFKNEFPSGGTLAEPGQSTESSNATGVAFASAVFPIRNSRWTFAAFYHELANFKAALDSEEILRPNGDTLSDRRGSLSLRIPGLGVAGAVKLSERLSLGASFVLYEISLDSVTSGSVSATAPPGATESRQVFASSDQSYGGVVGAQWSGARWTVGGVYRRAPRFDVSYAFVCGNRTAEAGGSIRCRDRAEGEPVPDLAGDSVFAAPDSYGLGLAFQATDRLLFSADIVEVRYSQLGEETKRITTQGRAEDFFIDDVTEVRFGAEYAVPLRNSRQLFLRLGAWSDPDHRMHYRGDVDNLDVRFNSVEEDQIHGTFGLGMTLGSRVSFDVGIDVADSVTTGALSTVVRF